MKKILLVFPHNLLQSPTGTNVRILQIIDILKDLGYEVDQFGYENFEPGVSFADFETQNTAQKILRKLYLYDFKNDPMYNNKLLKKTVRLLQLIRGRYIQSWVTPGARKRFAQIVESENYEAIIVFYTYLAPLLQSKSIKAKKIYFMEDSAFFQQHSVTGSAKRRLITAGKLLDSDLALIKLFDLTVCISKDEQLFYQRMLENQVEFVPHLIKNEPAKVDTPVTERKWDAFFIGFRNPFNEEGIRWFLDEVQPHLDKHLRVLLAGSATKCIDKQYNNVEVISYIEDLDAAYQDVKVVLCPMLRGTGMKIKVVEALSRGLPVVCTDRGVDGLPDKTMSGCLVTKDPKEFAQYVNRLCADPSYYDMTAERAKQYYAETFDKERYVQLLKRVLDGDQL